MKRVLKRAGLSECLLFEHVVFEPRWCFQHLSLADDVERRQVRSIENDEIGVIVGTEKTFVFQLEIHRWIRRRELDGFFQTPLVFQHQRLNRFQRQIRQRHAVGDQTTR